MKREPVSRSRSAKAMLSRDAVVAAAMRVMAVDGLAQVTMRRVAAELDTGPASLYAYVTGVAELHGLMVDELLDGVELPARVRTASWRKSLIDVLVQVTYVLYAEPNLALSVVSLRPSGDRYLQLLDWMLGALRRGGVPVRDAAWGVSLLMQHAVSTAAEHGIRNRETGARDDERAVVEAVAATAADTHPGLAWVGDELFSGGVDRLRWSFEVLVSGLASHPCP